MGGSTGKNTSLRTTTEGGRRPVVITTSSVAAAPTETSTGRITQLVNDLRTALQTANAADVRLEQVTAAQAASDQAWADVSRVRRELLDVISADAAGIDIDEYLAEQKKLRGFV